MEDNANVRVLPPFVLMAALAAGALVAFLAPTTMLPTRFAIAIGLVFVALSIPLVVTARLQMKRAATAFDARETTTMVLTTGVFRFTRNPVYLAMMLLYVGLAIVVNSPWMLLIALPTGSALCWTAIRP